MTAKFYLQNDSKQIFKKICFLQNKINFILLWLQHYVNILLLYFHYINRWLNGVSLKCGPGQLPNFVYKINYYLIFLCLGKGFNYDKFSYEHQTWSTVMVSSFYFFVKIIWPIAMVTKLLLKLAFQHKKLYVWL